jgi:hypothetical protein
MVSIDNASYIPSTKFSYANNYKMQNTEVFTPAQWEKEIQDAKDAHIDEFALNMVWPWNPLMTQLAQAFTAANKKGNFYMIFSFDYAGGDPDIGWPKKEVINLLKIYGKNGAYFQHNGQVPSFPHSKGQRGMRVGQKSKRSFLATLCRVGRLLEPREQSLPETW